MNTFKYFILKFIFFFGLFAHSQSNEVYNWFDNQVKVENTPIFNGVEFINTFNVIDNKHRFFETNTLTPSNIVYGGQKYFNIPLRYDLYDDQIVIAIGSGQSTNEIMLLKEKVSSFTVGTHFFENLDAAQLGSVSSPGFYQLLTENENFKLYKKNHKTIKRRLKDRRVFYEFNDLKPEYIVKTPDGFFRLNRMRDLTSRYPDYRNELSSFRLTSRDHNSNDRVLVTAINRLNTLINN